MPVPTAGTIAVAERIAALIEKAPAGGVFHDAVVGIVAGIEVSGFGGMAGFEVDMPDGTVYEVAVRQR